eukprot:scaffold118982_cov26-Prasinocladus_malaysianus.AAC.1
MSSPRTHRDGFENIARCEKAPRTKHAKISSIFGQSLQFRLTADRVSWTLDLGPGSSIRE